MNWKYGASEAVTVREGVVAYLGRGDSNPYPKVIYIVGSRRVAISYREIKINWDLKSYTLPAPGDRDDFQIFTRPTTFSSSLKGGKNGLKLILQNSTPKGFHALIFLLQHCFIFIMRYRWWWNYLMEGVQKLWGFYWVLQLQGVLVMVYKGRMKTSIIGRN